MTDILDFLPQLLVMLLISLDAYQYQFHTITVSFCFRFVSIFYFNMNLKYKQNSQNQFDTAVHCNLTGYWDTVHISSDRIGLYVTWFKSINSPTHARTHARTHIHTHACIHHSLTHTGLNIYIYIYIYIYCPILLPHVPSTLLLLLLLSFHEQRADCTSDMLIGTCNCSLICQQRCTISLIAAKVKWR